MNKWDNEITLKDIQTEETMIVSIGVYVISVGKNDHIFVQKIKNPNDSFV